MALAILQLHHMTCPTGEELTVVCPHCKSKIELTASLLSDNDTVTVNYVEEEDSEESAIHKGDRVRVVRIDTENEVVRDHLSCFLDRVGYVETEPEYKELLGGLIRNRGECWVEFRSPCSKHGENGGVFTVSELKKLDD